MNGMEEDGIRLSAVRYLFGRKMYRA